MILIPVSTTDRLRRENTGNHNDDERASAAEVGTTFLSAT
jgi:hypothetical protein